MENIKFLIQNNLINHNELDEIKKCIKGYPSIFINIIPFSDELSSEIGTDDYIVYGSTTLILNLLRSNKSYSGLFFNKNTFLIDVIQKRCIDFVNTFSVYNARDLVKESFSRNKEIFIRPNNDFKQFSGQVMAFGECVDWLQDAFIYENGSYWIDPNELICISEPKQFEAEYRFFVVNKKIISGSLYKLNNELVLQNIDDDKELIYRVNNILINNWLPHNTCVIDIVKYKSEYKILEFNCLNSSGFYKCNKKKVFDALWSYLNNDTR